MANSTYDILEIRIIVKPELTELYVRISTPPDFPIIGGLVHQDDSGVGACAAGGRKLVDRRDFLDGSARRAVELTAPFLTEHANASSQRTFDIAEPMRTQCAQVKGGHFALAAAHLVKYYGTGGQWQGCDEPMHTVPTKDRMGLVQVVQVPADIITPELLGRARACAAFLHEHLPEHFPEPADLVLVRGYVLINITLRMLAPKELARAQGFPATYILDRGANGQPITKTDQVRLIGNSVCPDVAEALIRANAADLIQLYARAA